MKVKIRTYNVLVKFLETKQGSVECKNHINFSQRLSYGLYEVLNFTVNPPEADTCSFKLHAKCYSCGGNSINKYRKSLLTAYPSIEFIEFHRER
jgi:hypothetical protein